MTVHRNHLDQFYDKSRIMNLSSNTKNGKIVIPRSERLNLPTPVRANPLTDFLLMFSQFCAIPLEMLKPSEDLISPECECKVALDGTQFVQTHFENCALAFEVVRSYFLRFPFPVHQRFQFCNLRGSQFPSRHLSLLFFRPCVNVGFSDFSSPLGWIFVFLLHISTKICIVFSPLELRMLTAGTIINIHIQKLSIFLEERLIRANAYAVTSLPFSHSFGNSDILSCHDFEKLSNAFAIIFSSRWWQDHVGQCFAFMKAENSTNTLLNIDRAARSSANTQVFAQGMSPPSLNTYTTLRARTLPFSSRVMSVFLSSDPV